MPIQSAKPLLCTYLFTFQLCVLCARKRHSLRIYLSLTSFNHSPKSDCRLCCLRVCPIAFLSCVVHTTHTIGGKTEWQHLKIRFSNHISMDGFTLYTLSEYLVIYWAFLSIFVVYLYVYVVWKLLIWAHVTARIVANAKVLYFDSATCNFRFLAIEVFQYFANNTIIAWQW